MLFFFIAGTSTILQQYSIKKAFATSSPRTIWVPDNFASIQEAVNNASEGDIIRVRPETYYEHVTINKSVSLEGENRKSTIIDGNKTGEVILVTAHNVGISGFTIQNGNIGIFLQFSNECKIYNNVITSHLSWAGVLLNYSSGNRIHDNWMLNNGDGPSGFLYGGGVELQNSNSNMIDHNLFLSNVVFGISLCLSYHNTILYNNISDNGEIGVDLVSSGYNIVRGNTIASTHGPGVEMWYSSHNLIEDNLISGNGIWDPFPMEGGISLRYTKLTTIKENAILGNAEYGIALIDLCPNSTVSGNTIQGSENGVDIHYSNHSVFYKNNFIDNYVHSSLDGYPDVNIWDNGAEGNYWSGFTGDDSNGNGIIDVPHILNIRNRDNYPLAEPWSETRTFPIIWDEVTYNVTVHCNSTVASTHFNQHCKYIGFNVTGPADSIGVCNVTIPLNLLWGKFTVLIDNIPYPYAIYENETHTIIYFVYHHTTHQVKIHGTEAIPEFPTATLLIIFMMITLLSTALLNKRHETRSKRG